MTIKTEDNNVEKEKVRALLNAEIQHFFGGREYSMLELLGAGIGAEFFLKSGAMKQLHCIENNEAKFEIWNKSKLNPLRVLYPEKRIESFCVDLYKFYNIAKAKKIRYDVINLDTMQYIGPLTYVSKQRTVYEHLESIFKNDVIADTGLILLNVIINGFRIEQGPYRNVVCRNQKQILDLTSKAADNYGYTIDDTNSSGFTYHSGGKGWTTMLHSVIPVSKRHP